MEIFRTSVKKCLAFVLAASCLDTDYCLSDSREAKHQVNSGPLVLRGVLATMVTTRASREKMTAHNKWILNTVHLFPLNHTDAVFQSLLSIQTSTAIRPMSVVMSSVAEISSNDQCSFSSNIRRLQSRLKHAL
ncbi:hypothetical protein RRG08_049998 [Elysia crispata]|uniref:Uncharacterized protein n=1 Tax=Elysia crispata TaxID=231223 RepID=A0AAE1EDL5_9GAST|nr:hypothetical protein RRG08_049998 [Elysia crispata]